MEDRKRTIFAVVIALIVVAALLYSFGLNLFSHTPELMLPDPDQIGSSQPGSAAPGEAAGIPVEVTPATVQSVVASLARYSSYSRTLSITYTWGGGTSTTTTAKVWEDGGWVRTDTALPSGLIEHSIIGKGSLWLWYEGAGDELNKQVYHGRAEELVADLMQRLPTYEDVLALDPAHITDAGYEERQGQPCIYVEVEQPDLGCVYRYWISTSNGLLMAAETEQDGVAVYSMSSNEVISPLAEQPSVFTLPDGEVLYGAD